MFNLFRSNKVGPAAPRRIEPGTVDFNMSVADMLSKDFKKEADAKREILDRQMPPRRGAVDRMFDFIPAQQLTPGERERRNDEAELREGIQEKREGLKKQQSIYDANFGLVALEKKGLPQDLIMSNISPFLQPLPSAVANRSAIVDLMRPVPDRNLRYPTDIPSRRPTISPFTEDPLHNQGLVNY
jgi:hypothetical protein